MHSRNPSLVVTDSPLSSPSWDAAVATLPGAGLFHLSAWARVLHETYHYPSVAFTLEQDGRLLGALPVMEVASWVTGRRGIALPFSDQCAPLAATTDVFRALVEAGVTHARHQKWRFLEIRGSGDFMRDEPSSNCFAHHRLSLSGGLQQIWKGFDESNRRAIRRASESPLEIRVSTHLDDVRAFYELHCGTRRHHGLPPQPFAFFEAIHRNFFKLERGRVFLASCERTPVAGALFLEDREVAYYKFAASDLPMQSLRPNNLVLWEAIQHYSHAGFQGIDLGRTSMHQDGLRRFKRGWGSVESTVDYHRIDPATNCQLREKSKETGWHNRVFRLLPIPLSRWFGGLLYRHAA